MSARYTVTVHSGSWEPDEHVHCAGWLEKHAVLWQARRLKRRTTIHRHTPVPRWARFLRPFIDPTTHRPPGGIP